MENKCSDITILLTKTQDLSGTLLLGQDFNLP